MSETTNDEMRHRNDFKDIKGKVLVKWYSSDAVPCVITLEEYQGGFRFLSGHLHSGEGWKFQPISLEVLDGYPINEMMAGVEE